MPQWERFDNIEDYAHQTGMPSNFWDGPGWYYDYCGSHLSYYQLSFVLRTRLDATKEFVPDLLSDQLDFVDSVLDSCPSLV